MLTRGPFALQLAGDVDVQLWETIVANRSTVHSALKVCVIPFDSLPSPSLYLTTTTPQDVFRPNKDIHAQ